MGENYVLNMENIVKDYYGNIVLKGVNLKVKPGEIHALLGENGAGKSTLMNILFGMPVIHSTGGFEGKVIFDGKENVIKTPEDAMSNGIGMVHQEFMLIPDYEITENIKLNREITRPNIISETFNKKSLEFLDRKAMASDTRKALDTLELDIDEWVRVSGLPVGYMQFVEIAREIDKENIKLLVFDEPTAVLTEKEAANLIKAMKKIANSGIAILFITHRLDEVMEAADNITILRDGELVATKATKDTDPLELAELMVGRKVEMKNIDRSNKSFDKNILEIRDFEVHMPGENVKGIDLDIKKGEILGVAGLAGQGKIGLANGIFGLYPTKGEVKLNGKKLPLNNTLSSLRHEMAFVSEDRRKMGLLLDSSIADNIVITDMQVNNRFLLPIGPIKLRNGTKIRNHANHMIQELDIRCTSLKQITRRLSGGNQQKVCVARALTLQPNVIFVSEPTRGIDIGAKKLVLDRLVKENIENDVTVVITSSELAELRSICDRIVIIAEGKVEGILSPDASDKDFGLMMAGEYHSYYNTKEGFDDTNN